MEPPSRSCRRPRRLQTRASSSSAPKPSLMEPPSRSCRRPRRLQTAPTTKRARIWGKGCCYTSSTSCLLTDIVLFEILPWLPVRTILKLKCVCRDWYRLLSGGSEGSHHRLAVEQFERSLRRPTPAASGTIYIKPGGNIFHYYGFDGSFLHLPVNINISSSAGIYIKNIATSTNGLCCLLCFRDHPGHASKSKASTPFIYICNPFTGRSGEEVPINDVESLDNFAPCHMLGTGRTVRAFALAFEPSEGDYKLVNFRCICSRLILPGGPSNECDFSFSLYSSGLGRWVESGSKFTTVSLFIESYMAYYWRTFYGEGKVYWDCFTFAVQYDIGRDAASQVELPEFDSKYTYLLEQQLELREGCLTCTRLLNAGDCIEVWVLLDDGGNKQWRWERKERVSIEMLLGKDPTLTCFPGRATIYEDEERRLCVQMTYTPLGFNSILMHYNLREKKVVYKRACQNGWTWEFTKGLIYRHHDSLHDVPS